MKRVLLRICFFFFVCIPIVQATDLSIAIQYGQSTNELITTSCENDRQFFTAVSGGQAFTCTVEDTDSALGISLSYQFSSLWGLELGYMDLGQTNQFTTGPEALIFPSGSNVADPETIDAIVAYFAGTATLMLGNNVSLSARLGTSYLEYDLFAPTFDAIPGVNGAFSDDSTSVMAGISLNYEFSRTWGVQLRYDYFDADFEGFASSSYDATTLSLGFTY